jgi:hypothetical protein
MIPLLEGIVVLALLVVGTTFLRAWIMTTTADRRTDARLRELQLERDIAETRLAERRLFAEELDRLAEDHAARDRRLEEGP